MTTSLLLLPVVPPVLLSRFHMFLPTQVLLLAGPDKGKTGYMIGMEGGSMAATKAIIKLETSSALGMREIKVCRGRSSVLFGLVPCLGFLLPFFPPMAVLS